jgi:hypothetical protein
VLGADPRREHTVGPAAQQQALSPEERTAFSTRLEQVKADP